MKKTTTSKKKPPARKAAKKTPPQKPRVSVRLGQKKQAAANIIPGKLLGKNEPPSARIENASGKGKCLVVCDHASNAIPAALGTLGLRKPDLKKHIAWDPGTADIGRRVAEELDAPVVLASYSRLVVDLNRGHDSKECMREESDHIRIPGNAGLSTAQREQRLDEIFWPYHRAVDAQLQKFLDRGVAPALLSIHSFTPEMDGFRRPWHIGVLWNREEDIARRLVENLRKNNPGLRIGENEPYSLKAANITKNTISTHAESRGLPYVIVEFRQDLVDTRKKAHKWAYIFLESLRPILADPALFRLRRDRC